MAKRAKTYNLFKKIRVALRDIYRYSPMRKASIKAASITDINKQKVFKCPICLQTMYIQMADVDHEPPLGPLTDLEGQYLPALGPWADRLFNGPVQVICKLCHKRKTAQQRSKK